MEQPPLVCPSCQYPVLATYFFCPNCGKKLKERPLSTSLWKQVGVYVMSILLPPFGLIPAIRYLSQPDTKSKMVGVVALLLTAVATFVTVYYTIVFVDEFNRTLTQQLQGIGY
jgi:hypothetical protein